MIKRLLSSAFVAASLFLPLAAHADTIPEGYHPVTNTVFIENANEYPDYTFYLTGTTHIGGFASQVLTDKPARVVISSFGAKFIAVSKDDVASIVSGEKADCPECGDQWFELDENTDVVVRDQNLMLNVAESLPDTNPAETVTYGIHIDHVGGYTMDSHISSVSVTKTGAGTITKGSVASYAQYDGGQALAYALASEENGDGVKVYVVQNASVPPLALILIGVGEVLVIFGVLAWRKK